jgi:hypothetical protein
MARTSRGAGLRASKKWTWFVAATWLAGVAHAQAQDELLDESADAEESASPAEEEAPAAAEPASGPHSFWHENHPREDPDKNYFFVGASWRYFRVPAWTLDWFMEAAPAVGSAGSFFGEFGYRSDGFQVTASVGWAKFSFSGPFQLKGDPPEDTEWQQARWNMLVTTGTVTWSTAFTDWFALEYGVEAGVAAIFGDMTRTEAQKVNGTWSPCPGPNPVDPQYCDIPLPEKDTNGDGQVGVGDQIPATNSASHDGEHYGVKAERGIANKGVPHAVPVLGPRLSLRFKPIKQLVLRVDVPMPLLPFGFMGGLAAQYGF